MEGGGVFNRIPVRLFWERIGRVKQTNHFALFFYLYSLVCCAVSKLCFFRKKCSTKSRQITYLYSENCVHGGKGKANTKGTQQKPLPWRATPPFHNQGLGLTWLTRSWASDLQLRAAARQITSLQYYCRILVDFQNITTDQYITTFDCSHLYNRFFLVTS